jgi:hypothetical protein
LFRDDVSGGGEGNSLLFFLGVDHREEDQQQIRIKIIALKLYFLHVQIYSLNQNGMLLGSCTE